MIRQRQIHGLLCSGLALLAGASAAAQTHVIRKPETVVRAVGVYEWTGAETKPSASRFVPVTLFIDGHLEDAAVYLARPVPFALQTGTIFELQHAGVPQGTLELSFARHLVETGEVPLDDGWLGFGPYKPLSAPKQVASTLRPGRITPIEVSGGKSRPSFNNQPAQAPAKPSAQPSTSTTTDNSVDPDRPTLNRKTGNPAEPAPAASTPATASTAGPSAKTDPDSQTNATQTSQEPAPKVAQDTPSTKPDADPDRSTVKRPADASGKKSDDDDRAPEADPERPTLRKRSDAQRQAARKEHDSSSVIAGTASLNDDPDRPNLHRGKAPGALDEDDLPALKGLPADVKQAVGVSDAARRDQHDFARPWEDDAERAAVLSSMQASARTLLSGYGAASAPPAAPTPPDAVRPVQRTTSVVQRKAEAAKARSVKPVGAPVLTDEQLHAYTLSYGGAATYVYSGTSAASEGSPRFVTLVVQRDQTGQLRTAMSSVTDGAHLDRTPRMQLVDAVDAEASNRASLLFELRAQTSRQFALYRVIGAQAQQIFLGGSTE